MKLSQQHNFGAKMYPINTLSGTNENYGSFEVFLRN